MTSPGITAASTTHVDRRQAMIGGALLVASAAAACLQSGRSEAAARVGVGFDRVVPHRIGAYRFASSTGLVLPARDERPSLAYDEVLTRIYVADGLAPVMLLIAYGAAQDADRALHRPEACYPSAGYRLTDSTEVPLVGVENAAAIAVTASRSGREEQLYFWTRIGEAFPTGRLAEKWEVLRSNLRRERVDGVLVRLSVRSADREAAVRQMAAFNRLLLRAVSPCGRRLLLGAGRST